MIDHVSIPVHDILSAGLFYDAVLAPVGLIRLVTREKAIGYGKHYPEFWLNSRPGTCPIGNTGAHVCLRADDQKAVRAFHIVALAIGAKDDGAPGDREAAVTSYFGAFILDPDGNKIEVVTFPKPPALIQP